MKIPFQDSREGMNMRWTDYRKWRNKRFREICDIVENCQEFMEPELLQPRCLIEKKLEGLRRC